MASIDGIQRAPRKQPRKQSTAQNVRVRQHTTRRAAAPENIVRASLPAPVAPDEQHRAKLLYLFVGIALIGVVGLWARGFSATWSSTSDTDGFLSSVVAQIKGVFTNSSADFEAVKKSAQDLGKSDVEKLEDRVFPDLPNLND